MNKVFVGFLAIALFAPIAVFATTIALCFPFSFTEQYSVNIASLPSGVEVHTYRDVYGGEFDYLINTGSKPFVIQGAVGVSNVGETVTLVDRMATVAYVNGISNAYTGDAAAGAASLSKLAHKAIERKIHDAMMRPVQPAPEPFAIPALYEGRPIAITGSITYVMHEKTCTNNVLGASGGVLIADKINALLAQVKALQNLILSFRGQPAAFVATPKSAETCFVPTYDLYIGRTDAETNGDVTKLQDFLLNEGYGDPDGDSGFLLQKATGYYGQMTAAAVTKWQKAHGMDFVTLTSGVGKQTRAKMKEACSSNLGQSCIRGRTMNPPVDLPPVITSLSNSSGPIGSVLEIRGCNLSGFEGDLDVTFEKSDGSKVMLVDKFNSYPATADTLIKVIVKEPCMQGETVYGPYSGLPSACNYTPLIPGAYKVYTTPWGKKSNVMNFTVTAQ